MATKYVLTLSSVLFDVCAGPDGNVWTCAYNDVVSKVTPAGVVTTYSGPSRAEGIIKGPDGNLWLTNALAGGVGKMTTGGAFTNYGGSGVDTCGICVGPDGNLWYTYGSASPTHIEAVTTGGSAVISVSPSGATALLSICTGPDGNLWVADTGNKLWQVTTAGVCTAVTLASHAPTNSRRAVSVGPDGNLWVAAGGLWQVATGTVAAGSNGGMLSGIAAWVFPSPGVLDVASTAGFPTSGTLNVVTTGGNGFIAYTGVAGGNQFTGCTYLSGTGTTVGTGAVVTGATYFAPSGVSANCVCAGPDGNLWVGDQTHHCVWQINTSGVVLAQIILTGSTPNSICAGPDGNIWVLDNTSGSYAVWVIVLSTPKVYVGPLVVG